jgi:ABC-type oligopeptide transport system substrate-binding subunit
VLAYGAGSLWVGRDEGVVRIDPATERVAGTVGVSGVVQSLAVGGGFLWAGTADGTLWQIDPSSLRPLRSIPVGRIAGSLAWAGGALWLARAGSSALLRVDPASGARRSLPLRGEQVALAAVGGPRGRVLAAVAAGSPAPPGALRLAFAGSVTTDPAFAWDQDSWRVEYATCLTLVGHPDRPGAPGAGVVADGAALPAVSAGGRVYRFRLRRGLRFSPPSREPVTAATFKHAIERALSPALGPDAPLAGIGFLDDVVGVPRFRAGGAAHVDGLQANGDVLTVRLRRPDGDLPARLALPFFCAVPLATPIARGPLPHPVATAGPYYVASASASGLVLRRNPSYAGPRPHRLPALVVDTGIDAELGAAGVASGRYDYAENASARHLSPLFAPGGPLERAFASAPGHRRAGGERYLEGTELALSFLDFNTASGLFREARVRRAVDGVLDRSALAAAFGVRPARAYLPRGLTGARPSAAAEPRAPRRVPLVGTAGARAVVLVRELSSCPLCAAGLRVLRADLARLGIGLRVRQVPDPFQTALTHARGWDISFDDNWVFDYPDPADFLGLAFDGRTLGTPGSQDVTRLDVPAVNRALDRARALRGSARTAAYTRLAQALERREAPIAVYGTLAIPAVVSARVGCAVEQPVYGLDLAALCRRQ